jgi:plasmid stability protein
LEPQPPFSPDKVQVNIRLATADRDAMKALAKEHGRSFEAEMRQAVRVYLLESQVT